MRVGCVVWFVSTEWIDLNLALVAAASYPFYPFRAEALRISTYTTFVLCRTYQIWSTQVLQTKSRAWYYNHPSEWHGAQYNICSAGAQYWLLLNFAVLHLHEFRTNVRHDKPQLGIPCQKDRLWTWTKSRWTWRLLAIRKVDPRSCAGVTWVIDFILGRTYMTRPYGSTSKPPINRHLYNEWRN